MGNVIGSGILSSMGTTGTTQLTDKVDSPHSGLFKALHAMSQGNLALDYGATDTHGNFGFSHTYTAPTGGNGWRVVVQGGLILNEGEMKTIDDSATIDLNQLGSGTLYHWIVVVNGASAPTVIMGTVDSVVPDLTAQATPISLIKVQSTDTSGDLATQFFTTTKQSNSVSIGYDNSSEYKEMGNLSASGSGFFITGTTTAHNVAGTATTIQGSSTTAGTTNNIAGGSLTIAGGQGKGSGAGGDIIFKTANAGGSGSSINSLATALTISDDLSATFAGTLNLGSVAAAGTDTDKFLVLDSSGNVDFRTGTQVASDIGVSGAATLTGSTDNTIVTVTGANAITGEANLTFDATTLAVTGKQTITPANDVGGAALTITNQDTDQIALDIDASNIDANVIDITANALTTGSALNIATSATNDNAGSLVKIAQTGSRAGSAASIGLDIDFNTVANANARALRIDSEQSTGIVAEINADGITTGDVINISADALTTGEVLKINSSSSDSSARRLIDIRNDNTAATGTTPLMVWNDAATGSSAADVYIVGTANSPNDGPSLRLHRNPVHTTTHTCTTNSNTTVDGITATTDIRAGMAVSGSGIQSGSYVVSVTDGGSGTTAFVLSAAATASATVTLTFSGSGNSDYLGDVQFYGEDRGGSDQEYANLTARIQSTKVGDEAGALFFNIKNAGSNSTMIYATGNENGAGSVTMNYSANNIDFRVKGDNEVNLLYCDAGNDRIGLATASPKNILQVNHSGADSDDGILVVRDDATTVANEILGGIGFDSSDGNVPSSITEASAFIASYATEAHSATAKGGRLKFGITVAGTADDQTSTVMANLGPPITTSNTTATGDGFNARATTAIVGAATYAPTVEDSGTLVIFNHANSNLTLPSVNTDDIYTGVQFTVFNQTGSTISAQIAVSNSATINGAAATGADDIESYKAATFVCSGNNTWIRIG